VSGQQLELFPLGSVEKLDLPPKPALHSKDTLQAALPFFSAYMQQKEFAENTRKSFLNDLKLFLEYVGGETPLAECTTPRLEAFIRYLQTGRGVPCSGKSLDRRITTLKVFFGWLANSNILAADPAAPLVHEGALSPLPQILTDKQVEELLAVTRSMRDAAEAPDARPHLLVSLILATGIKKSECMGIALQHVDISDTEHPSAYIQYNKPRQRFKTRRLALPEDWVATLGVYMRRYQPRARLFECTPRNLEYVLHTTAILANLPEALTFETLRWTAAVRSFRAGMDEEHLRKRLGLSKISWVGALPIIRKLAEDPL
jgi:site-specific recombinase XerD